MMFFCFRIPADLQNNDNNSADGVKSNTENNNTNEAESDIALANNNSMKSDNDSEKPINNVDIDEVGLNIIFLIYNLQCDIKI